MSKSILYKPFVVSLYCGRQFYLMTVENTAGLVLSLNDLITNIKQDVRQIALEDNTKDATYTSIYNRFLAKDASIQLPEASRPFIEGRQFVNIDLAIKACTNIANNVSISYKHRNRARDFELMFKTGEFNEQVKAALGEHSAPTNMLYQSRMQHQELKQEQKNRGLFFYKNGLRKIPNNIPAWERPLGQIKD